MFRSDFTQVDVFGRGALMGNPLAVVLDARGLDSAQMQHIAHWMNLSETSFVLPAEHAGADYRVRIFTPCRELPFAGHPSVGTAWAVIEAGIVAPRDGHMAMECAAGVLPVRVEGGAESMTTHVRAAHAQRLDTGARGKDLLARALAGLKLGASPPALWDNGPHWWLAELADVAAVRALQPDLGAIVALCRATQGTGLAVFGRNPFGSEHALVVRAFCPAEGIPEDPVTGSAQAAIAAHLHAEDALGDIGHGYRASQGREVQRDGEITVSIDDDGEVWIGGACSLVISGTFTQD